jgi:hypothetical protein
MVVAGFQIRAVWQGEVQVPRFVMQQLESQLAAQGLEATLGSALFDPRGRLLVRDLDLRLPGSTEPLVTARALFLQLDPWDLLRGQVNPARIELVAGHLYVPAMLSPSGRHEAVLDATHLTLAFDAARRAQVVELITRLGELPVTARSDWVAWDDLPQPTGVASRHLASSLRRIASLTQQAAVQLARLPPHHQPMLDLHVTAPANGLTVWEAQVRLASLSWAHPAAGSLPAGTLDLHEVSARLRGPLDLRASSPWAAQVQIAALQQDRWGHAEQVELHLTLPAWPPSGTLADLRLQVRADRLTHQSYTATMMAGEARSHAWPRAQAELRGVVAGAPWQVNLHRDATLTRLDFDAEVAPRLVEWVGRAVQRDLTPFLRFDHPARLRLQLRLDPTGRPIAARGGFAGGPAVARRVELDYARADFSWADTRLQVRDLALYAGADHAHGSYDMDTETLDFRFLLEGRMRPDTIDGWFRDWWPRFWTNFEFPTGPPPRATVDARGRWRTPELARVYVTVDAAGPRLRDAAFDRVRTRLFVRPEFTDVLDFHGERPEGVGRGRFTVFWDRAARANRHVDLDLRTTVQLGVLSQLFPAGGPALIAPFQLSAPPRLHVRGRLDGPAVGSDSPGTHLEITGEAAGPWEFWEFPLHDLSFRARYSPDLILVEDLAVGFAEGRATGRLEIAGATADRRLSFDLTLLDAGLGESIRRLEVWGARRQDLPPPPRSRFQDRVASGRLNLALSASGPYGDPLGFVGEGHVDVTEATLGQVNLLGILSSLLRRTLLDFSTLELDTARSNFTLAADRIFFPDLLLTGPRAAINASGDYHLASRQLAFNARVQPFEAGRGLLGSTVGLVLSPLSHVLEVRLGGTLADPSWAFVYGPTSFLRALGGGESAPNDPATRDEG